MFVNGTLIGLLGILTGVVHVRLALLLPTGANWIVGGGRTDIVNPILTLANKFNISYYDQVYNIVGYEKDSIIPVDVKTVEKEVKNFLKARDCLDEISWAGKSGIVLFVPPTDI